MRRFSGLPVTTRQAPSCARVISMMEPPWAAISMSASSFGLLKRKSYGNITSREVNSWLTHSTPRVPSSVSGTKPT